MLDARIVSAHRVCNPVSANEFVFGMWPYIVLDEQSDVQVKNKQVLQPELKA